MDKIKEEYEFLWQRCCQDSPVLILAHGAGASKESAFMDGIADLIFKQHISVVRFDFSYMQKRRVEGKRYFPDRKPILLERWRKVLEQINAQVSVPVFIGGKSMGGRMATLLLAEQPMLQNLCYGVVCLGYPFYSPKKYENPRIEHFQGIRKPVFILQGERDVMGDKEHVASYSFKKNVEIRWFSGGDHDLKPLKSIGISHEEYLSKASLCIAKFINNNI